MQDQTQDPAGTAGPDAAGAGTDGAGRDRAREEFRLLLEALAARAEEFLCGLGASGDTTDRHATGRAGHGEGPGGRESCPMCAFLASRQGGRRDLGASVSNQLVALLAALRRALLEDASGSFPDAAAAGGTATSGSGTVGDRSGDRHGPDSATTAKVQHIDVQRVRGNVVRQGGAGERTTGEGAREHGC